jgi:thiol-disulfide isomerase/thioredoxin
MRSVFVKVIAVLIAGFSLYVGYHNLPVYQSTKIDIETPVAQEFLKEFAGYSVPKEKTLLPNGTVLTNDNKAVMLETITNGRWTLVNLWATWCAPCVVELPSLLRFSQSRDDMQVLAISFDNNQTIEQLSQFMAKNKVESLKWVYDDMLQIRRGIETRGLPTSLLVNPQGEIVLIMEGHVEWDSKVSQKFFDQIFTKS